MSVKTLMTRVLLAMMVVLAAISAHAAEPAGAVYTLSNQPDGNSVLVFDRAVDGTLISADAFPTGGRGTGTSLGTRARWR